MFKRIRNLDLIWRVVWFVGFLILLNLALWPIAWIFHVVYLGWLIGIIRFGLIAILALMILPGRKD